MRKIWRYKSVQFIVFILIASSLGIIISNLETLQFVLKSGNLAIENDVVKYLIKYIKTVQITAVILWVFAIGLYLNFIYSINSKITKKTNIKS